MWHASVDKKIVARGDFISSVSEEYWHPYVAEICRLLSITISVDSILSRFSYPSIVFETKISSNCQSVIDSLWNTSPIITLNKYLY